MDCILKAEHLTKTFVSQGRDDYTAVDDVSFSMNYGEKLAIIGESGSGKTTIVNMITRLLDVTSGTVYLDGEEITNLSGKKLKPVYKKMQMVFQTPTESFDPRQTLGDGIGEGLRNLGISRREAGKKTEQLLEKCGLDASYADRYPHQVSGGQCQRAAIARALAVEPKVLICDEATSALNVTVQQQIMELLQTLRKSRGISYVFICHNLALVQSFCERLQVMYGGKIVEEGTPNEVILCPKSDYTKLLLDSIL